MKKLAILRHAEAGFGQDDHSRALTNQGISKLRNIKTEVNANLLEDAIIVSSTAIRCRQTLDELLSGTRFEGKFQYRDPLYNAPLDTLLSQIWSSDESKDQVVICAHNPGLSDLIYHLSGQSVFLNTGNFVLLESDIDSWNETQVMTFKLLKSI